MPCDSLLRWDYTAGHGVGSDSTYRRLACPRIRDHAVWQDLRHELVLVLAQLVGIAEAHHRRPVWLLLLEKRDELVIDLPVLDRMNDHVDTGLDEGFLILQPGHVRVHDDAMLVSLLDNRAVNLGRHLLMGASRRVSLVDPDLDLGNLLGSDGTDRGDGLALRRDFARGGESFPCVSQWGPQAG